MVSATIFTSYNDAKWANGDGQNTGKQDRKITWELVGSGFNRQMCVFFLFQIEGSVSMIILNVTRCSLANQPQYRSLFKYFLSCKKRSCCRRQLNNKEKSTWQCSHWLLRSPNNAQLLSLFLIKQTICTDITTEHEGRIKLHNLKTGLECLICQTWL